MNNILNNQNKKSNVIDSRPAQRRRRRLAILGVTLAAASIAGVVFVSLMSTPNNEEFTPDVAGDTTLPRASDIREELTSNPVFSDAPRSAEEISAELELSEDEILQEDEWEEVLTEHCSDGHCDAGHLAESHPEGLVAPAQQDPNTTPATTLPSLEGQDTAPTVPDVTTTTVPAPAGECASDETCITDAALELLTSIFPVASHSGSIFNLPADTYVTVGSKVINDEPSATSFLSYSTVCDSTTSCETVMSLTASMMFIVGDDLSLSEFSDAFSSELCGVVASDFGVSCNYQLGGKVSISYEGGLVFVTVTTAPLAASDYTPNDSWSAYAGSVSA